MESYLTETKKLIFGDNSSLATSSNVLPIVYVAHYLTKKVVAIETISATESLRIACDFIKEMLGSTIAVGIPTYGIDSKYCYFI